MPSYSRGFTKEKIKYVSLNLGRLRYGFRPKDFTQIPGVTVADIEALGWWEPPNSPVGGYAILGATSPKPQKVKKVLRKNPGASEQGSITTFCSEYRFETSQSMGWELVGSRLNITVSNNNRTKTVGVAMTSDQHLYLFPMNAENLEIVNLTTSEQILLEETERIELSAEIIRTLLTGSSGSNP